MISWWTRECGDALRIDIGPMGNGRCREVLITMAATTDVEYGNYSIGGNIYYPEESEKAKGVEYPSESPAIEGMVRGSIHNSGGGFFVAIWDVWNIIDCK